MISFKLGKRAVDALLDRSPSQVTKEDIRRLIEDIPEVTRVHNIKIRTAGANTFIDLNIHVSPDLTINQAHQISHQAEEKIKVIVHKCEVHVHAEPEEDE
jgi:divalent metal cation (Fe/Co/Zn/Cd) transporter